MASKSKSALATVLAQSPDGGTAISDVLRAAEPRPAPSDPQTAKNQYAVRFADAMAARMALDLAIHFRGIEASTKRRSAASKGKKQLDINFSTPHLGLALGVSLKSVHLREVGGSARYTHNMKRNEEELRIEASGYHRRQPYAVMVGVLLLPFDSCTDAKLDNSPSSFGSWVRHLRPISNRESPHDDADRFERLYIALYEIDGSKLVFFDARTAPPKNGLPTARGALFGPAGRREPPLRVMSYAEFIDEVHHAYLEQNDAEFSWSDGEEAPLDEVQIQGDHSFTERDAE